MRSFARNEFKMIFRSHLSKLKRNNFLEYDATGKYEYDLNVNRMSHAMFAKQKKGLRVE